MVKRWISPSFTFRYFITEILKIPTSQRELPGKFVTGDCSIGFELKKKPAILPVSVDFEKKWKLILEEAEKKLAEELLVESEIIVASTETQIQLEIKDGNPSNFLRVHISNIS